MVEIMKLAARGKFVRAKFAMLFGALTLGGCATYSSSFGVIESNLAAQQYDIALQNIEKQSASKNEHVLYLLNKGMVLRMKRDFVGSNQAMEAAKAEMEELYAASVSENALSFIVNDATVSYAGDDYEQVLVHLYMALNYLELNQPDAARVEALQVDIKLREIGENTPESRFTEVAFSRYLTGLIYEDGGEWSDAMISYREAYEAYAKSQSEYSLAMPEMLKHDLLRLAKRQGLAEELSKYKKEFEIERKKTDAASSPGQGELIFILNNGLVPIKRENSINSIDPSSGTLVRIALPYYESRTNNVVSVRISVADKQATSELMEDIDAIAKNSLNSHMPAIIARSLARAVVKVASSKNVQRSNNNNDASTAGVLGAMAVQVAALATERADTRSWLTLPANIHLARLSLPPGSYNVKVELLGTDSEIIDSREYSGIEINKAHKTFLTQHWVPARTHTQ